MEAKQLFSEKLSISAGVPQGSIFVPESSQCKIFFCTNLSYVIKIINMLQGHDVIIVTVIFSC